MKKTLLTFTMLIAGYCAFAQVKTTNEEYAYMQSGYQEQVNKGLDMKKGYTVDAPLAFAEGNFTYQYIALRRTAENNAIVGYIVKGHSKSANKDYWFAIPVGNSDLMGSFFTQVKKLDTAETQGLLQSIVELKFMR